MPIRKRDSKTRRGLLLGGERRNTMNSLAVRQGDESLGATTKKAIATVIAVATMAVPTLFVFGGVGVGMRILPWLMLLSILLLGLDVVILVPLAFIRRTRAWAGVGFYVSAFVFGLTGWSMGLILTWALWGGLAVFVGIFLLGIGVIPIAMLAALCNGMWLDLGVLVLAVILTFGLGSLGSFLGDNA